MSGIDPDHAYRALRTPPGRSCDLVMKGGVTSGVIYPKAILELARNYRLASIGGTSAGAIAAGFAAAAEYGRSSGGFERLGDVATEIPSTLLSLFQPTPLLAPFFEAALRVTQAKQDRLRTLLSSASTIFHGYASTSTRGLMWGGAIGTALGATLGGVLGLLAGWLSAANHHWSGDMMLPAALGALVGACLLGTLGAVMGVAAAFLHLATTLVRDALPQNFFGVCPGTTQPGASGPGLTHWLHEKLNSMAGLQQNEPLTFAHLARSRRNQGEPPIALEVLTTCLSKARPYKLPFSDEEFFFKKSDFDRLFPIEVVDYLVSRGGPSKTAGYFRLPAGQQLPVVVAIRMSLSFPILLSAVPLYAVDPTLKDPPDREVLQRLIFSDGGISSNLPIHFFDAPLPGRPTFAINLEAHDEARHAATFVDLPQEAGDGAASSVQPVATLAQFFGGILDAMRNWQDNLRLQQPGTRERVVTVRLEKGQGGLNLAMDPEQVKTLIERGQLAGRKLRDEFDFQEHKWRRYLVWSRALEKALRLQRLRYADSVAVVDQVASNIGGPEVSDYAKFLESYESRSYEAPSPAWRSEVHRRTRELMDLVGRHDGVTGQAPLMSFDDHNAPQPQPEPVLALLPKQ